ncbi:MAG TPA: nitrilase-related carbon-nitrogen hydrolase [bacterium]|nr:nitrilase-related carbon-nitrogen hydrolase [bacterium]HOL34935.1 nitrilase-related carbon-nitrogen hydrolase [bacterium]HPP08295.1 nitrilase-related carbon-nitrogen hydrolase [bacterium]
MKICLCQFDIKWENKQENKTRIREILSGIEKNQVDLIIFPETTLTGFSFNKEITSLMQQDIEFFSDIAQRHSSYVCFGGIDDNKNVCITINPQGRLISKTGKIHLFSPSGEPLHHCPERKIVSFCIGKTTITPFICYDLRFAPLFWTSAEKTDIFIVIANWPEKRKAHWKILLQARAIENQAIVAGVNRIGESPDEKYSGDSCVIDPWGNVIIDAESSPGAFVCDIRIEQVSEIRRSFPILKDRLKFSEYGKL